MSVITSSRVYLYDSVNKGYKVHQPNIVHKVGVKQIHVFISVHKYSIVLEAKLQLFMSDVYTYIYQNVIFFDYQ